MMLAAAAIATSPTMVRANAVFDRDSRRRPAEVRKRRHAISLDPEIVGEKAPMRKTGAAKKRNSPQLFLWP
jgi:hypothetical protein